MNTKQKFTRSSAGAMGIELESFPSTYKQPSREHKRKIQCGYLDLLYYEYREDIEQKQFETGIYLFIAAGATWWLHEYYVLVSMLLAVIAAFLTFTAYRNARVFQPARRNVEIALRQLSVGINGRQLNSSIGHSTAWHDKELRNYASSDLGIVHPMTEKDVLDDFHLFDLFEDRNYRQY